MTILDLAAHAGLTVGRTRAILDYHGILPVRYERTGRRGAPRAIYGPDAAAALDLPRPTGIHRRPKNIS